MSLKLNERYPGRFNNPSADYPEGSFKNRTSPVAKDGSYLEQDWANDREGFFQSLLAAAGIDANGTVDKVGASQFFDALQKLKQTQAGTAFTATGPAATLVLTPAPAITAYAAGQRFRVKFNRASTGTDTINVSGKGPLSLKQYDATGAKVAAVFAIDQLADVEYDGTDWVVLNPLAVQQIGTQGSFKNLEASASGASSVVTISAEEAIVKNAAGQALLLSNLFLSVNLAASGLNGLDTGTVAASSCYSIWAISNGTTKGAIAALCPVLTGNTTAGSGVVTALSTTASMRTGMPFSGGSFPPGAVVLSVDSPTQITASLPAGATATGASLRFVYDPVMPAGYTFKAMASAIPTDGTANKFPWGFNQTGRNAQLLIGTGKNLTLLPQMAVGAQGTIGTTLVPVAVAAFVPPTATRIRGIVFNGGGITSTQVAPNSIATIPGSTAINASVGSNGGASFSVGFDFLLESAFIYYAGSAAGCEIRCLGWELNL